MEADDDASVMTLIRLDVIVTGFVDVLSCDNLEEIYEEGIMQENDNDENVEQPPEIRNVREKTSLRGGRVPLKSALKFKSFFPIAGS